MLCYKCLWLNITVLLFFININICGRPTKRTYMPIGGLNMEDLPDWWWEDWQQEELGQNLNVTDSRDVSGIKTSGEYRTDEVCDSNSSSSYVPLTSAKLKDYIGSSLMEQYQQLDRMEDPKYWSPFQENVSRFLIPDVVNEVPDQCVDGMFSSVVLHDKRLEKKKLVIDLGTYFSPEQSYKAPHLDWLDDWRKFYTVMMIDPDSPERTKPIHRHWLHWLIINSVGDDIKKGKVVAEYVGPWPERTTGKHRYVILVFMQKEKIQFKRDLFVPKSNFTIRRNFNYLSFATKYNLGKPAACNYFTSSWSPFVERKYGEYFLNRTGIGYD